MSMESLLFYLHFNCEHITYVIFNPVTVIFVTGKLKSVK